VRDGFWAGLADTFDTQQAQLSDSNDLSAVGFSAGAGSSGRRWALR
jgi:hypothetical protein